MPRRESTRDLGRRGEDIARAWLERQGLRIVARNVHLRHSELDLVALDGDALCFIEVRLRRSQRYGTGDASVNARKRSRIVRGARQLLATRRLPYHRTLRFDVIAIDAWLEPPRVRHIRDAFQA